MLSEKKLEENFEIKHSEMAYIMKTNHTYKFLFRIFTKVVLDFYPYVLPELKGYKWFSLIFSRFPESVWTNFFRKNRIREKNKNQTKTNDLFQVD